LPFLKKSPDVPNCCWSFLMIGLCRFGISLFDESKLEKHFPSSWLVLKTVVDTGAS
jgi:hypothetical protein